MSVSNSVIISLPFTKTYCYLYVIFRMLIAPSVQRLWDVTYVGRFYEVRTDL